MSARERIHELVDQLSDEELGTAERMLKQIKALHQDPVWKAIQTAPEDDEPESKAEARAVAEANDAISRGEVVSDEEIKRELGL